MMIPLPPVDARLLIDAMIRRGVLRAKETKRRPKY
jgi:hypothetical protein